MGLLQVQGETTSVLSSKDYMDLPLISNNVCTLRTCQKTAFHSLLPNVQISEEMFMEETKN